MRRHLRLAEDGFRNRLFGPDALKNGVDAKARRELTDAFNRLRASLADDICRAEFPSERDPVGMAAEDNDLLSAESPRSDHGTQTDGAVTNDGDRFPGPTRAITAA